MSFAVSAILTSALLATAPGGAYTAASAAPRPQALINALADLRAAAWPGAQAVSIPQLPAAVPAAAAAPSAAPTPAPNPDKFTQAEIAQLLKFDKQYAHPTTFKAHWSEILGLTTGSQVLTVYELHLDFPKDPAETGVEHYFTPLPDGAYLFFRKEVNSSGITLSHDFFILNHDRSLRAAYRILPPNRVAQRISPWEAKTRLAIEIHAWRNGIAGKDYNN